MSDVQIWLENSRRPIS